MIMRVTWGKITPGKWDEFERLWNDHARHTAGASGLKGRWLLLDTDQPNAGYSLSLWETQADFEAYTSSGPREGSDALAACYVGQYVTTVCEVRGQQ